MTAALPLLQLTRGDELEAEIERRVAERCRTEATLWKFRLITAEAIMMGALVFAAGVLLDKPIGLVTRAALLVSGSCFASGILLLGLSNAGARLWIRFRRRGS